MLKLYILRVIFIIGITIVMPFSGKLHYPLKWLRHYIIGSGKAMNVPSGLVHEAFSALCYAGGADNYGDSPLYLKGQSGRFCVNHSTLYEGHGFYNRPTLFYLLGGFSFTAELDMLVGEDHYDWHSDENGNYFTSPLGDSKVILKLLKIAGAIFGTEYFTLCGFPSGEAGISNKLWEDLQFVGAKPFDSYFEYKMTRKEESKFKSHVKWAKEHFDAYRVEGIEDFIASFNSDVIGYKEAYNMITEGKEAFHAAIWRIVIDELKDGGVTVNKSNRKIAYKIIKEGIIESLQHDPIYLKYIV